MKKYSAIKKDTFREIKKTPGRYLAILAIIALGVGFFSGLRITESAMLKTADKYVKDHNMFDFELISTLGITKENVDEIASLEGVTSVQGSVSRDFEAELEDRKPVLKALSISDKINTPSLKYGRMPSSGDECLADARLFGEDDIGKKIRVSDTNDDDTKSTFAHEEYTIVGICDSVLYMNIERGTSKLGEGKVSAFVYIPEDGLEFDVYTETYVTVDKTGKIYSDEYKDSSGRFESILEDALTELARSRGDELASEIEKNLSELLAGYEALYGDAAKDMLESNEDYVAAREKIASLKSPAVYVLGRDTNVGYACFESDASIVSGVAKVFPIFFFLVAALVCTTTMTRMVDDKRTEIGTLKALGYSDSRIAFKYVMYSGSAAVIGCVVGFFGGCALFPAAIWHAYSMLYGFAPIEYVFNVWLALISLAVALVCSVGATLSVFASDARKMPGELMRPKSPKAGKRVFLERIPFLWNRLGFLRKVSARNVFRYKKRLFMMILGIGGCTSLVLTGLGIRDSIGNVGEDQFGKIMVYDYEMTFSSPKSSDEMSSFDDETRDLLAKCVFASVKTVTANTDSGIKNVNLVVSRDSSIAEMIKLNSNGKELEFPAKGYAAVNRKLAEEFGVGVGDEIALDVSETEKIVFKVGCVFDNYVYNYVIVSEETYRDVAGEEARYNVAFATAKSDDSDSLHTCAAKLINEHGAASVTVTADMRERIVNMMNSLNSIVWLVIGCAAALSFIVLFNLGNINITERKREIATIKVLGFTSSETSAYVLRENIVLTAMGVPVGLVLGYFLHAFVMSCINIDLVSFDSKILPISYLYAVVLTFVFTFVADLIMRRKTDAINMAESLKSVE